ncbi:MAG: hypothetical protein JRJ38_10425 [Deltaproteobacteria bacterium]|nr:hypothetical protein [Deltaproteobacteria bacterium]
MKLYVEINNEKHYIEKDFVEKYGLLEGLVTPFTGLEIKREDDDTIAEAVRVNEVETDLTKDLVQISSGGDGYANEAFDSEDLPSIAELASQFGGVEQSNEILTQAYDTEEPINAPENTDFQAEAIKTSVDEPALVADTTSEKLEGQRSSAQKV